VSALDVAQALWLLVAATGLALSVSYAGLPVLGAGAFLAVGGYGTALLGPGGADWPLGLAVLASVALAAAAGWLVGLGA
jgi:ABC-type branched-subunit amino acid transport system permease subunit